MTPAVTPVPALTVIPDTSDEDEDTEDHTGRCAICKETLNEDHDGEVHSVCAAIEMRAFGLPVPEVAALLKVTERTVYRWTNSKAAGA